MSWPSAVLFGSGIVFTTGLVWFFVQAWIFAIQARTVWLIVLLTITTTVAVLSQGYLCAIFVSIPPILMSTTSSIYEQIVQAKRVLRFVLERQIDAGVGSSNKLFRDFMTSATESSGNNLFSSSLENRSSERCKWDLHASHDDMPGTTFCNPERSCVFGERGLEVDQ